MDDNAFGNHAHGAYVTAFALVVTSRSANSNTVITVNPPRLNVSVLLLKSLLFLTLLLTTIQQCFRVNVTQLYTVAMNR